MRTLGGVVLLGVSLVLAAFGMLFLLGADGQGYRFVIAAIGLLAGASAGMGGALLIWRGIQSSPVRIRRELLALAQARDGELRAAEVDGAFGFRADGAHEVLREMVLADDCRRGEGSDGAYLFPALQPRLLLRRCEHCGHEAPLASDAEACPSCGATLNVKREARQADDRLYGMDQ
jgi:hypothetical protein